MIHTRSAGAKSHRDLIKEDYMNMKSWIRLTLRMPETVMSDICKYKERNESMNDFIVSAIECFCADLDRERIDEAFESMNAVVGPSAKIKKQPNRLGTCHGGHGENARLYLGPHVKQADCVDWRPV